MLEKVYIMRESDFKLFFLIFGKLREWAHINRMLETRYEGKFLCGDRQAQLCFSKQY